MKTLVGDGIETDIVVTLAGLEQHHLRGPVGYDFQGIGAGGGHDSSAGGKQGQFRGIGQHPQLIQGQGRHPLADPLQIAGHPLGLFEHLPHPQVHGGAGQLQGVLQGGLHPYIEPAVDSPLEKLQGEIVDHPHRGYGDQSEHHHQPQGQSGTGLAVAVLVDQSVEVVEDQDGQQSQPGGGRQQQPGIDLTKAGRVFGGLAHQHQHRQQQQEQSGHRQSPPPAPPAYHRDHRYHGLASRHWLDR